MMLRVSLSNAHDYRCTTYKTRVDYNCGIAGAEIIFAARSFFVSVYVINLLVIRPGTESGHIMLFLSLKVEINFY